MHFMNMVDLKKKKKSLAAILDAILNFQVSTKKFERLIPYPYSTGYAQHFDILQLL